MQAGPGQLVVLAENLREPIAAEEDTLFLVTRGLARRRRRLEPGSRGRPPLKRLMTPASTASSPTPLPSRGERSERLQRRGGVSLARP